MNKLTFLLLLLGSVMFFSCSKENSPVNEEKKLVIALNPDPGGTFLKSLGATYNFNLIIESSLPEKGVDILVSYKKEADNTLIFSQSFQGVSPQVSLFVNNISFNDMGIVTVDVKSKSDSSNTAAISFRLIRK